MLGGLNSNSPTFLITDCINYFRLELGLELACLDFLWKKNHTGFPFNFVFSSQDVEKKGHDIWIKNFFGVVLKKSTYTLYTAFWFSSVLCHESLLQTIASLRAFSPLLNQEGEKNEGRAVHRRKAPNTHSSTEWQAVHVHMCSPCPVSSLLLFLSLASVYWSNGLCGSRPLAHIPHYSF